MSEADVDDRSRWLVGNLRTANGPLAAVPPGTPIEHVEDVMLYEDFSQVPVIRGRECKGVVTWKSIATARKSRAPLKVVDECVERVEAVARDARLLDVIPTIVKHGFVLVQAQDRTFTGIVTATDVFAHYGLITEPFVLLEHIEGALRRLITRSGTLEEIRAAVDRGDAGRRVDSVADLTFGEYVRFLEPRDRWERLGVKVGRDLFIEELKAVHRIRNDVMHHRGAAAAQVETLRKFERFLEKMV